MIRLIIIVSLVLFSCTDNGTQSRTRDVDRIEIIDNQSKFSHTETRKEIIQEFKEVLKVEPESTDCMPQGTILFKKGDEIRLLVGYYKDASACAFLIIEDGDKKMGYRLSPDALLYLGVYFQKLKQQKLK